MKLIIITIFILFSATINAQSKDTTVQTSMKLSEYRAVRNAIEVNIDSKKTTEEILSFLDKHTFIIPSKQDTTIKKK